MDRFMRLVLMYDLDMSDEQAIKNYNKFRKRLITRGFIMMQYSIYMKILNSPTKEDYEIAAIKKWVPKNGNVRILTVTDKQYQKMHFLRGGKRINETINTEERRIIIDHEDRD